MPADVPRILLVEDEPTLADITAFRLELLGYEVEIRPGADQALQRLEQQPIDLVILDLGLGAGNGLELLNQLSNDPRHSALPVLVFSTSSDLEDVQRAYAAGAEDFLVTPYDPANLEQKIEKLLAARVT